MKSFAQRLRDRESSAWVEFNTTYRKRLKGYVRRKLYGLPAWVEDVVQDILADVSMGIDGFDESRGNIDQWVFTIARRRTVDRVRQEGRRQTVPLSEGQRHNDRALECGCNALDSLIADETGARLRSLLADDLHSRHGVSAGVLADIIAGMSTREAADRAGVDVPTASQWRIKMVKRVRRKSERVLS